MPEEGFVFCCFNNSYKITPQVFDVWMRLLKALPGSVLWLSGGNHFALANLHREAKIRSVEAQRLIFATPEPLMADHLARHRVAGLFLDTFPYQRPYDRQRCPAGGPSLVDLVRADLCVTSGGKLASHA